MLTALLAQPSATAATTYRLPWEGTWNVTQGAHGGEGRSWDFQPTGGGGSHNDKVLAVAAGTARITCSDGYDQANVELNVGGKVFSYAHLQTSAVAAAGVTEAGVQVSQGQVIGRLHPSPPGAPIADKCGYAIPAGASHLHLTVPELPMTIDGEAFSASGPSGGTLTSTNRETITNGRVWVHGVKSTDVAFHRRSEKNAGGWTSGYAQLAGRWKSLSNTVDEDGRVWMIGIKTDGTLRYRYTIGAGSGGWTSYRSLSGSGWVSVTSTVDDGGRVWIHALKADGRAYYRSTYPHAAGWKAGYTQLSGLWKSLSSTVDEDGRVWMIGVKKDGTLRYRYTIGAGTGGWTGYRSLSGSNWRQVTSTVD